MDVHFSSKSNEWATPLDFFKQVDARYNFTFDLACTHENKKCPNGFTIEDDSLSQDWHKIKGWLWLNPPYGRGLRHWVEKAKMESRKGAKIVMLIPARTDTSYWHDFIFDGASDINFLRGRLKFGGSKNSAPFPSALVEFGGDNV